MTFLRPTGSQWRTPEMGRAYVVSAWRGVTRVQIWPKARGTPKTEAERKRLTIFALYQTLIKWLGFQESDYERQAIIEYNRTHRGQRGSAAIRLRDWQTQRLYGRGVAVTYNGIYTFYPPAVRRDASFLLDHVTQELNQIVQRTGTRWEAIPAGTERQVLKAGTPGSANSWQTF